MSDRTTETAPGPPDSPKDEMPPADEYPVIFDPRDDQDDSLSWVDEPSSDETPFADGSTAFHPSADRDSPSHEAQVNEASMTEPSPEDCTETLAPDVDNNSANHAAVSVGLSSLPTSTIVSNTPLLPTTQEDADFLLAQQLQAEFDAESAQLLNNAQSRTNTNPLDSNEHKRQVRLDKGGKTLESI